MDYSRAYYFSMVISSLIEAALAINFYTAFHKVRSYFGGLSRIILSIAGLSSEMLLL